MVMPFRAPVASDNPDTNVNQLAGDIAPGWQPPKSGVERPGPSRLALYHQNWTGVHQWQTWCNLEFPDTTRPVIENQNAQAGALNIQSRVQNRAAAPRPIPLEQYTLPTRTVYIGTIDANGRINQ